MITRDDLAAGAAESWCIARNVPPTESSAVTTMAAMTPNHGTPADERSLGAATGSANGLLNGPVAGAARGPALAGNRSRDSRSPAAEVARDGRNRAAEAADSSYPTIGCS